MRRDLYWCLRMVFSVGTWAQEQSSTSSQSSSSSQTPSEAKPAKKTAPDLAPPRSDRVNAADLGEGIGESSSKDTQIDLSPPADDAKKHPESSEAESDPEARDVGYLGASPSYNPPQD